MLVWGVQLQRVPIVAAHEVVGKIGECFGAIAPETWVGGSTESETEGHEKKAADGNEAARCSVGCVVEPAIGGFVINLGLVDAFLWVSPTETNDGVDVTSQGVPEQTRRYCFFLETFVNGEARAEAKGLIVGEAILGYDLSAIVDC